MHEDCEEDLAIFRAPFIAAWSVPPDESESFIQNLNTVTKGQFGVATTGGFLVAAGGNMLWASNVRRSRQGGRAVYGTEISRTYHGILVTLNSFSLPSKSAENAGPVALNLSASTRSGIDNPCTTSTS